MAHKKGGGSSRNGRDSQSQRLGVKVFGGERVRSGNILVRHGQPGVHKVGEQFGIPAFVALESFQLATRVD